MKRLAFSVLMVVILLFGVLTLAIAALAAVPGPGGSKTCIGYCEANGFVEQFKEQYGFTEPDHARFHTPKGHHLCPFVDIISNANPPQPRN